MSAQSQSFLTPQDYLCWERQQETRHEFLDGHVFAMTGVSRAHNVLCLNIASSLHQQLRGKPCEIYANDMRVKVSETGMYTYPDIVAVCGEPRFEDAAVDTLLNPVLIVEVLSESTERHDRGAKFTHYRSLASLREYWLISQTLMPRRTLCATVRQSLAVGGVSRPRRRNRPDQPRCQPPSGRGLRALIDPRQACTLKP